MSRTEKKSKVAAKAAKPRAQVKAAAKKATVKKSPPKSAAKSKPAGKTPAKAKSSPAKKPSTKSKPAAAKKATKPVKPAAAKTAPKSEMKTPRKAATKAVDTPVKTTTKEKALSSGGKKKTEIVLSPDYRPSEDEPFMNEKQRAYFRNKLKTWKEEIIRQTRQTLAGLHEDSTQHADLADRATSETDRALELRARDRQRKLIAKIDAALARIEDGSYGYCEETGEPIGLKRLDARPIATLSLEAQERHERRERVYRED